MCLQAATLSAHTSYKPGEQVYDSYGPLLAPTDLLLDYGYCDTTNTNHRVEVDVTQIGTGAGLLEHHHQSLGRRTGASEDVQAHI